MPPALGNDDWFGALLVLYVLPLVQKDISEFMGGRTLRYVRGILKSLGTNGNSDLLNGHFRLADYAGGEFFKYGGEFRRRFPIWRRIFS